MAFKMKNSALYMSAKSGTPMQKNYGGSPMDQRVADLDENGNVKTSIDDSEEMKNKDGKTQTDIMNKRDKGVTDATDKGKAFQAYLKKTYPDGLPSQGSTDKANAKINELNDKVKKMGDAYNFSSDSINDVNAKKKIERDSKAKKDSTDNANINFDNF
tara:strand:+ start:76 stop:549 length:474 start_codon:yes stop_codon:yes gene_type:complete